MKTEITIGVACLARKTFDFHAAAQIYQKIIGQLKEIEAVEWVFHPELVIDVTDAQQMGAQFHKSAVDGWICISGTFALGNLVLEIQKRVKKPVLLWGLDELPYDGGKIRLNSVCGLNLNASNLYKAGTRNFATIIGEDPTQLATWLDALRIIVALQTAHIGLIGYRAQGFFNLDVDELGLFQEIGALVSHYELATVFETAAEPDLVKHYKIQIEATFVSDSLPHTKVEKVAELAAKFATFMENEGLTNIAVRCWPEFANLFGISPCAAMSLLQAEGKILTCEGDVLGSMSMLAHAAIGAETPFLADFSQVDLAQDFALLWHCGVAPYNLWDGVSTRALDGYFAGGRGVTADFVMKSGPISLARLDYSPPGEYRVFLQRGKAVPMTQDLKGTYMKATFPVKGGVRSVLQTIIDNGIAHHISVVYGEFLAPFQMFCKIMDWQCIESPET